MIAGRYLVRAADSDVSVDGDEHGDPKFFFYFSELFSDTSEHIHFFIFSFFFFFHFLVVCSVRSIKQTRQLLSAR